MNRRGFLKLAASLLPLPAFVKASSLLLPKEKPLVTEVPVELLEDFDAVVREMLASHKRRIEMELYYGSHTPGWMLRSPVLFTNITNA